MKIKKTIEEIKDIRKALEESYKKSIFRIETEKIPSPFQFESFSQKQKSVFNWWKSTKYKSKDGIIADGAIRSGKTMSFSLSYIEWAMSTFNKKRFAIAGQSITSALENIVSGLITMLHSLKTRKVKQKMRIVRAELKKNKLIISAWVAGKLKHNSFEIVGGKDEGSYRLIQGRTYAGALMDEVVLMPESFVNQLIARCSIEGRKLWYTCNPEGPHHWFKAKFIDKIKKLNLIRIHFRLDDNPSLAESIKDGYKRQYDGVFYQRYIEGLWVAAEGLIYSVFSKVKNLMSMSLVPDSADLQYLSIDYGTRNPFRCGLYHILKGKFRDEVYKVDEYSYCGREKKKDKTDRQYVDDIIKFVAYYNMVPSQLKGVIVDPSAKSLIAALKEVGFRVIEGINDVIPGIRKTIEAFYTGMLKITEECTYTLKELYQYVWDEKTSEKGEDRPIKENDHSMDETRYLIYTLWKRGIIKI